MTALLELIAFGGIVYLAFWLESVRRSVKAIQRELGADPKWEAGQAARVIHTEQQAQQQAGQRRV